MKIAFILGLIVGLLVIPAGVYLYFTGGYAPVATSSGAMPFENFLARKAFQARLAKATILKPPFEPNETNLLAGAALYRQHCAVCHGLPGESKSAIAEGMYPPPPQLFLGKGVTDDEPGETFWKAANGIRLTGMPGFKHTLKNDQLWEISLLLANADKLPASVQNTLARPESTVR